MNTFSIKDLEQLSGIKAHTIRIWEQRFSFLKPNRTGTNIRYYTNEELKNVLNVSLLNRYGFKISHIDKMSTKEMEEKILALSQSEAQQERIVNELINQMIVLNTEEFENILNKFIATKGIEKTITTVVFSLLEKIGLLWQTNHIIPAQEHLVTNIIRQKIIIGIENLNGSVVRDNKSVLLFLPEGEYHEICLLFVHYLLKRKGIKVIYLGANTPLKDVSFLVNLKKPLYLYTHLTAVGTKFNLDKFFTKLHSIIPDTKIVISGQLVNGYKKSIPSNIELKNSLNDVLDYIQTM